MNLIFMLLLCVVVGYLLGSVNTSLLVGKFLYKTDIRDYGSGNAGTTNALRVLGKKATLYVLLGDFLKGILACGIAKYLVGDAALSQEIAIAVAGLVVVIGHIWPVYFNFKGGKGVLTTLAVALMMDWKITLVLLLVFIVIVAITKYVSLGSIVGISMFPIMYIVCNKNYILIIFSVLLAAIVLIKHRDNFKRIFAGTENKLSTKKVINK